MMKGNAGKFGIGKNGLEGKGGRTCMSTPNDKAKMSKGGKQSKGTPGGSEGKKVGSL